CSARARDAVAAGLRRAGVESRGVDRRRAARAVSGVDVPRDRPRRAAARPRARSAARVRDRRGRRARRARSRDDGARRARRVALGHVAIGAALGAMVWLPAAERLVAYGQHFPNKLLSGVELAQALVSAAMPATAYAIVTCTGLVGAALGAFARRADVAFVAA